MGSARMVGLTGQSQPVFGCGEFCTLQGRSGYIFTSPTLHDRRECQFSFAPRQRPQWIPGIRGRLEAKLCRYAALKSPQPPIHTQACLLETEAIYLHTALQGQPARAEWGNRSDVE